MYLALDASSSLLAGPVAMVCLCHLGICTGLTCAISAVPCASAISRRCCHLHSLSHVWCGYCHKHLACLLCADSTMLLLLQILAGLIEESDNPATLLEALMLHLLPPRKDANSAAYRCEACSVLMQLCHGTACII
jgi:hypothetical protein